MIKNECEVKAGFDPAALFQVREAKMTSKTSLVETVRHSIQAINLRIRGRPRVIGVGQQAHTLFEPSGKVTIFLK